MKDKSDGVFMFFIFYFYCNLLRKYMDDLNVEDEFLKFYNKVVN